MAISLTTEQIVALAPDPASAKAGQALASPGKWGALGWKEQAVWGECQGSGSKPYQVQIDLSEPAFRCTCPSRKFPCKHGLGLFLIFVNHAAAVREGAAPAWVAEWLAKRGEKAEKQKSVSAEPERPKSEAELAKAAEQQTKRAEQREKKVADGLADLQLWLCDLARHGLASVQSRPYKFWDEAAGRLVDAQAPGPARMLREMASIPATGEGWQERLVEQIGLLTLLAEAYSRIETLPEPVQADVRDALGWNVRQDGVLTGEGVADTWSVLGQNAYGEEQLRVSRTWLRGRNSGRYALILQFTRPGQPLETVLAAGTQFEGEMAFFPGACSLRALVKARSAATEPLTALPARLSIAAALDACADMLARSPWIAVLPIVLGQVTPAVSNGIWHVQDQDSISLPLDSDFAQGWKLMAVSGGHPVDLFGEWNGRELFPLSAWHQGKLILLM